MTKYQDFILDSLHESLRTLDLSRSLIDAILVLNLKNSKDVWNFIAAHREELHQAYWTEFRKKRLPKIYKRFIIPHIPSPGTLLDVGCGRGGFLKQLSAKLKRIGVDVNSYPEWEQSGINFHRIKPHQFSEILKTTKPTCVTFLWSLHHATRKVQQDYFGALGKHLLLGSKVVVLEDGYSNKLKPCYGMSWHKRLMSLSPTERQKVIYHLDYLANRVLAGDTKMPIPGTYRTIEDWIKLAGQNGIRLIQADYIGFPKNHDVYTPQSVMVFRKV